MIRLVGLLRALGNAGAVANARSLAADRQRDDWAIAALERRVASPPVRRTA